MRVHPRIAEHIFTVVALLFYTGGPLPLFLSDGRNDILSPTPVDFTLVILCFQLIYIITLFYLVPHWKRAVYLLVKDKLILLLMIIIFLSFFWSVNPEKTFFRSLAIFGTTLFGVYFATRYSLKQQLHLLGWVFGLASLMSIFLAVALPKYGFMQIASLAGALRGIYTHKNTLGANMALSTITFLNLDAFDRKKNWIVRIGVFVSIVLLLLSRSSSPLIILLAVTIAFIVSQVLRWEYRSKAAALSLFTAFGCILYICFVFQSEGIANAFGKDLSLTGRTGLWDSVWELIQKKPWLGYGYGALWSDWDSETGVIWKTVGWKAPSAHNGFLEVWLSLGILGLSVLLIHIFTNFMRILTLIGQTRSTAYFLPFMVLLFILLSSITESTFIDRNSITWVLYVSTLLSLQLKSNISENASLQGNDEPQYKGTVSKNLSIRK